MRRPFRTVVVCGIRLPLYKEQGLADAEGSVLDGLFQNAQGQVLIRDGLTKTQERDAVNHELQHALWTFSGAGHYLAGVVKDGVDVSEVEETIIRIMSPHIGGIGWVK